MKIDELLGCTGMKIAIATPFYNVQGFSPYISSLMKTVYFMGRHMDIEFDFWNLSGESYIDRARNTLCNNLLESDFTHLFFIDSDESWGLEGFLNVLKAPYEIVGAGYPCKNLPGFFGCVLNYDEYKMPVIDKATGLISALTVPTGFMKISRTALEKLVPRVDTYVRPSDSSKEDYDFFSRILPLGEDGSFNLRCERAGIPRWVETRVEISHFWVEEHRDIYHDRLFKNLKEDYSIGHAGCMEKLIIGTQEDKNGTPGNESGQDLQGIEEEGNGQDQSGENSAIAGIVDGKADDRAEQAGSEEAVHDEKEEERIAENDGN